MVEVQNFFFLNDDIPNKYSGNGQHQVHRRGVI